MRSKEVNKKFIKKKKNCVLIGCYGNQLATEIFIAILVKDNFARFSRISISVGVDRIALIVVSCVQISYVVKRFLIHKWKHCCRCHNFLLKKTNHKIYWLSCNRLSVNKNNNASLRQNCCNNNKKNRQM